MERKDIYLHEVWKFIGEENGKRQVVSPKSLQLYLTIMCSMANFFFPLTDDTVVPDVRQHSTFWELVQLGLYSDNPAVRKRSIYLLKRIVDTCERSESDFIPGKTSTGDPWATVPHFVWSKQHQKNLSKVWEDIFLLLETLDEKQTHVIKPILPRMQTLLDAAKTGEGSPALHTSWIVTLLMRAFHHESVFIVRWAAETVLFMDFHSLPFVEQGQLQFLTEKLLGFLQDLKLYQRPDGSPVGSCSSVGSGLQQFFASVCRSLDSKQHKVEFVQHVLLTLRRENWSSVPLVFITQGLSCIAPDAILDCSTLVSIREIIFASLTTLETFTRGAIECFMTKTVLNLIDKNAVGIEELMETLALMEREESLQRGTGLWSSVVSWLLSSAPDHQPHPAWSWASLKAALQTMLDSYLTVAPDVSGNVVSESLRATKIGRLVMLMADCESQMNQETHVNKGPSGPDSGSQPLLTTVLGKAVDVIKSINTRVYMPVLKADRAIYILLSCVRELRPDKGGRQDACGKQLCCLLQSCWDELLLYIKRRVFVTGPENENSVDLDLVVFYTDAVKTLGEVILCGAGVHSLCELVTSCMAIMETASAPSLHQVAAVSLLSAVAQVVEVKVTGEEEEKGGRDGGRQEEGVQMLSSKLCTFFSTMTVDCNIFASQRGGGSAHHGRQVCQYMMSQWQCLRMLLSHCPHLLPAHRVLHNALDAFSVSSGETDIPIMQCLERVMPQLANEADQWDQVVEVMEVAWGKIHEEIKSWSFWLKMEAFVHMVLQQPLLMLASQQHNPVGAHMTRVVKHFFEVGPDKAGLLNLVMGRLCQLWRQEGGTALAITMVPTIVDACVFGTLHKKAERLWLDVCMYIETLGKECSVNDILSSSSKNDLYVRLETINFLSTLRLGVADEETLARSVLREAWGRYWALAQLSTFRQYTNSLPHRQKHRLVQLLPLLDQFIDQSGCDEWCQKVWEGLVVECHPSVRQNLEWLALRLVHRFPHQLLPFLWNYFSQFTDKRNISLLSLLHIVTRLGPELPEELREEFYLQAMPLVVPWAMAHHFNTRLHGQAALCQLWRQCQRMQLQARHFTIVDSCIKFLSSNGNSSAVLEKLLDNYFYNQFHFLRDYSLETLLYTLPRLACLSDDEWMHPDLFQQLDCSWQTADHSHLLPLYNDSKELATCQPGPWKMKATAETGEDSNDSTEGDVQKKIIPWRLMMPDSSVEQEYSCRKRNHRQDGLILVTSLINKVPNLGGLCRTSEIFGVSEFVIGNLSYLNDRTFQSLSVTAEKWIPITEVQSFRLSEFLEEKKRDSYVLVGVEQTANSVELTKYNFPKKTLLVLGNEKEGIPPDLLQQLDVCVEIPQQGIIRSLNVHVSGALLIWEYTRQQMEQVL